MTVLMVSHLAMAGTSQWNGTSGLSGNNQSIPDALKFGNATVIDAWLHVDESGYLEDGYGETWTGEDCLAISLPANSPILWLGNSKAQCH